MKPRSTAPLPFMGQKRHFVKTMLRELKILETQGIFHKDTIFVDVFGGSGLIAHNIKHAFPNHRVIWNDFDNYQQRLDNIENTNALCAKICRIAKRKTGYRIHEDAKCEILEFLQQQKGYIDFLTISTKVLFSGNFAQSYDELTKKIFYSTSNAFVPYNAEGYLEGVERISFDFLELLNILKDKDIFAIYDPPYLFSDTSGYSKGWSVKEFLALLNVLKPPFMLFSSSRSGILEFLESFYGFENIEVFTRSQRINHHATYEDYLILQKSPPPPAQNLCMGRCLKGF